MRQHLHRPCRLSVRTALSARTALAVGAAAVIGLAISACGSSSPSTSSSAAGQAGTSAAAPAAGTVNCTYTPGGRPAKQVDFPPKAEPNTGTETAQIALTGGTVTIALDPATAPCTVGSFAHLAEAGYYNDTPCHRMTKSATLSVLQCGDPSGTGGGGPGYTYADETTPDMVYPAGTVAMANAGPDTNGSQFFLVYADSTLPPDYTVFGQITSGLDVIQGIAAQGITGSGNATAPVQPVEISTVTVSS